MTIVLLESIHEDARAMLAELDGVAQIGAPDELAALPGAPVVALLTRGKGRVTRELIGRCPDLRVVARCGVGLDNIDLQAAAERSIPVIYAPGSATNAVAEHTLLLMLAAARRLRPLAAAVHAGNWAVRDGYGGIELTGKTLGVVGLGAIGRRVASLGEAFGMRVIYWSRASATTRYQARTLPDLLREADVVSLHLSLTGETRGVIGANEIALMKPGALLINTSRGAVIDQQALLHALDRGYLAGFAADVLEPEPPEPGERLLDHERVLITPHTAVLTDVTYREMCVRTARNVLAVLRGEPPEPESVFKG